MQDQTGKDDQGARQDKPDSQYGGMNMQYISGGEEFMNNNGSGYKAQKNKNQPHRTEGCHRFIIAQ